MTAADVLRAVAGLSPADQRQLLALLWDRPDLPLTSAIRSLVASANGQKRQVAEIALEQSRRLTCRRRVDPANIDRAVEILTLRNDNPKLWTLTRLAERYGVSRGYVSGVLRDRALWMRRAVNAKKVATD